MIHGGLRGLRDMRRHVVWMGETGTARAGCEPCALPWFPPCELLCVRVLSVIIHGFGVNLFIYLASESAVRVITLGTHTVNQDQGHLGHGTRYAKELHRHPPWLFATELTNQYIGTQKHLEVPAKSTVHCSLYSLQSRVQPPFVIDYLQFKYDQELTSLYFDRTKG